MTSDGDVLAGNDLGTLVENALIRLDDAVPSSENRIRLEIVAGTFVDNGQNLDATAWLDARPGSPGTVGSENTVELLIRETRSAAPAAFHICDGSPAEPSNRVILLGPAVAFEKSNDNVVIVRCSG